MKLEDLTGKRFGKLVVISRAVNDEKGYVRWNCVCDCGSQTVVRAGNLKSGAVKSCGCLRHKSYSTTHSMSKTRLYSTWCNMRNRCANPNVKSYREYGARGISVCKEWNNFETFMKWAISNGYNDSMTIERVDNDKDYCPENCTWIPKSEQVNNRRMNRMITYQGKTQNLMQWCKELNLDYRLIHNRISKLGMPFEDAISMPIMTQKRNKEAKKKYG